MSAMLQKFHGQRSGLGYINVHIKKKKFQAAGHRYIAVGYTNGVLAFFDLVSTSALLRRTDSDGVQIIFPYNIFQGHFTQIIGKCCISSPYY